MMIRVSRRLDRADLRRTDADGLAILQDTDLLLGDRSDMAPQRLHLISENACRGVDQLGGINEMARTIRMDVNGCAEIREPPRRAGVIEVDVANKYVPHISRLEAMRAQFGGDIVERRFRSGIEERDAVSSFQRGRRDDSGPAKLSCIENVDVVHRA